MIYTNEDLNGFFVGTFFGDGCFVKKSETHNTYVSFKHCEAQKMYLEWKYLFLQKFWLVKKDKKIQQKKLMGCYDNAQKQFGFNSNSCEQLNKFKYKSKIELMQEFNEMALAIYALDDGNFYGHVCKISCGVLSEEEKVELKNILLNKLKIDCKIYRHKTDSSKDYFIITGSNYDTLIKIILSKIPNDIDVIKNKILKENQNIMNQNIKIKYFTNKIDKLERIEGDKSDWIDLRAAETIELKAGEFKLIPLGVAMQLPEGYEAHIVPRSSTYKNFGIIQTNHQAVIDESYNGDNDQWFYPAYALRDTVINMNDRICQFRIIKKQPPINFEEVEVLKNEDRGGIGSTGTN